MNIIDEFDYVFHKALANSVVNDCAPLVKKVSTIADKLMDKLFAVKQKIQQQKDSKKINILSQEYDELKDKLINVLCVKDRLQLIIKRNNERETFLNDKIQSAGIYVNKFDKKKAQEIKNEYKEKVTEEKLNINQNNSLNNVVLKNFKGELLVFVNGKLDLSREENVEILSKASQEFVIQIINEYPESVNTILPNNLLNVGFKKKISKAIASYVMNGKEDSVREINKKMGNLLSFKTEIPKDPESYVAGVLNMFNFMVKQHLIISNSENESEIHRKLKCNDKSELIPASKKIIAFADGLAGKEIENEELESQDVRIEKEKELEQDLFMQFELDMEAIEKELEAELLKEEKENAEREEKRRQENIENEREEEVEEYREMVKRPTDVD